MTPQPVPPEHVVKTRAGTIVQDPPLAQFLFGDTRFAVVWLILRVLLGLTWLEAGLEKLSNPAWTQTGTALQGFWTSAVQNPSSGRPPISFDWYRGFIQSMLDSGAYVWFAKLIVLGEIAVGLALILGMFVGIFAFIGAFLNWNYIMAGAASTNGLDGLAAVLLILAWKTAGFYGLDRWLLPLIGTPWQRTTDTEVSPIEQPPDTRIRE